MSTDPKVWLAAMLTIGMLSMVFAKENPFYKIAVHIFIGIGAGHVIVVGLGIVRSGAWNPIVQQGKYAVLVPAILGLLIFARFSRRYAYLAAPTLALIVAVAAGLGLRGAVIAQFLDQIRATIVPLSSFNNIILVTAVISTLLYFLFTGFYTSKLVGPLKYVPQYGKYVMMVSFGASFASAGAGFLSKLIARVVFLAHDWLGII